MIGSNRGAIVEHEEPADATGKRGDEAREGGGSNLNRWGKKESFIEFKLSNCYNSTINEWMTPFMQ